MHGIAMTTWGALPAVRIASADGAEATVTLYGAHLVSWKDAGGSERLFVSERSARDGTRAIRGGVPVIFPQFAERGSGMRHGFARVSTWRVDQSGDGADHGDSAHAVFVLTRADLAPAIAAAWPHGFELRLRIAVRGAQLSFALDVRNAGDDSLTFSAALHTYFAVAAIGAARIEGVHADELSIADKHDQIYRHVPGPITLAYGSSRLTLVQDGFDDAVVWNPGAADTAALADMADDDYLRFVCVEPARIDPVTLASGAAWRGTHTISAA